MGYLQWLREGRDGSEFPRPSGLDELRYLRRRKGVHSDRLLRNLNRTDFEMRVTQRSPAFAQVTYGIHYKPLDFSLRRSEQRSL